LCWFAARALAQCPEPYDEARVPHAGTVCFTPFFHVMGFVANFLFNLYAGCRVALLASSDEKLSPLLVLDACRVLLPSVLNTVPWVVEGLVELLRRGDPSDAGPVLARLHLVTYGGAALAPHCSEILRRHGVTVACTYGQTELAGPVMFGEPGGDANALRPFSGVEYTLVKGADDAENEGELVLLSCGSTTAGYLPLHPPSKESGAAGPRSLTGGAPCATTERFCTNDRFREVQIDGAPWLTYLCRRDDLLVHTSGEMTNPLITEQAILAESQGLVSEGGAVLCGTGMTRPVLVVELPKGASSDDSHMHAVLLDAVAKANALQPAYSAVLPQHVWLFPSGSLQRTVKGTIQRKPVEKMLLANSLPDGAVKLKAEGSDGKVRARPTFLPPSACARSCPPRSLPLFDQGTAEFDSLALTVSAEATAEHFVPLHMYAIASICILYSHFRAQLFNSQHGQDFFNALSMITTNGTQHAEG